MSRSPSEPLAATLHTFRATAFGLPPRLWGELPAHTQHQWRLIAVRITERLDEIGRVSGRDCFQAWAAHMEAEWTTQPDIYRERWNRMAALVNQAMAHRKAA